MKELNEKELTLVVQEKNLGTLKTNALSIKQKVEEILPNYDAKNYDSTNIDKAKEDKALLNKTSKLLNDERIRLEKEFNAPFEEFKTIVNDTCKLIKEASNQIDEIVKTEENKEKTAKRELIENVFKENVGNLIDLISLEKIFNDRWLNKTYKIEDIEKEIQETFKSIKEGLETIESLNSKYETELKAYYLDTLDLSSAIKRNNELMTKDEILNKQSEVRVEEKKLEEEVKLQEMATAKVEEKVFDPEMTYTLKITGKKSQLLALKTFLNTNNMTFEKIES